MQDEEYQPHEIGDYGARAQPALVARMSPHLRLTQVGNGLALIGLVLAIIAQITFPGDYAGGLGLAAMITTLVTSVLMLAICSFQHLAWLRAMAEWRGEKDYDLASLARTSWILHLISYAVAIALLWGTITASATAGWSATASVLLAFVLLFGIAAQICAAVQFLRDSGPPGTIPSHMRKLLSRANPRAPRPGDQR